MRARAHGGDKDVIPHHLDRVLRRSVLTGGADQTPD